MHLPRHRNCSRYRALRTVRFGCSCWLFPGRCCCRWGWRCCRWVRRFLHQERLVPRCRRHPAELGRCWRYCSWRCQAWTRWGLPLACPHLIPELRPRQRRKRLRVVPRRLARRNCGARGYIPPVAKMQQTEPGTWSRCCAITAPKRGPGSPRLVTRAALRTRRPAWSPHRSLEARRTTRTQYPSRSPTC